MENRAWKGVRLVSESIKEGHKEYYYEIGWHVPIGMFYLEEQITYLDRNPKASFGSMPFFSKRITPLIRHIEQVRNIEIQLDNEEAVKSQEEYAIENGHRILKKYPKWKTEISPDKILA